MKTLLRALSGLMMLGLFAPNLLVFAQEVPLVTVNVDENTSASNPIQETEGSTIVPEVSVAATVSEENVVVETLENTDEQNEKEVSLETKVSNTNPPGIPDQSTAGVSVSKSIPQPDKSTGALTYAYQVDVPPGRNSFTPMVTLEYNSQNEENFSTLGYGWEVSIPFITRRNVYGVEKLYDNNDFRSSLHGDLVYVSTTGTLKKFLPTTQTTDSPLYYLDTTTDTWTLNLKDGQVFVFGSSSSSREDDPLNLAHISKWMLATQTDRNNNVITYTYTKDQNKLYPSDINYSIFDISFITEARTDSMTSFAAGFSITNAQRIKNIVVKKVGTITKTFTIDYSLGDNGKRSLVNSISDGIQTTAFNYTKASYPIYDGANFQTVNAPGNIVPATSGIIVGDVNGDARSDIIKAYSWNYVSYSEDKGIYIYDSSTDSYVLSTAYTVPPGIMIYHDNPFNKFDGGTRLLDFNGDFKSDLMRTPYAATQHAPDKEVNNGNGFTNIPNGNLYDVHYVENPYHTIFSQDFNGDGLVDYLQDGNAFWNGSSLSYTTQTSLNNGNDFNYVSTPQHTGFGTIPYAYTPVFTGANQQLFFDINGDNLPDIIQADGYYTSEPPYYYAVQKVYINNGSSWQLDPSYTLPAGWAYWINGLNGISNSPSVIADFNNDGLNDIFHVGGYVYINQGKSFIPYGFSNSMQSLMGGVASNPAGRQNPYLMMDHNGDGAIDFLANGSAFLNNTGTHTDLLKQITYSTGGTTEIAYKSSATYKDASNNLLNPALPYIVQTVHSIKTIDPVGGVVTRYEYEYANGSNFYANVFDRKFAGFGKVTSKQTDGTGAVVHNVTQTYLHQGNDNDVISFEGGDTKSKIGYPYQVVSYDNAGNVYQKTINKWDAVNLAPGSDLVLLARQIVQTFDGNSTHRDVASEYTYDNTNGNVTSKTNYGEVTANNNGTFTDTGNDKSIENISYAFTSGNSVIGLPSHNTVFDQNGNKVRESKFYYDNLTFGSIDKGNQTKVEGWRVGTTYKVSQRTYNTLGLVTSETDSRGKVTNYVYEPHNLYPSSITNPMGHVMQYEYDYTLGKIKKIIDQNGFIYQTSYDGLGRVLSETVPDAYGTSVTKTTYVYTDIPNAVSVQKTDYLDDQNGVETYQYFDGLNRLVQERKEAEVAGTFNVRDIKYNNIGLVQSESLPYVGTGAGKTSPTGDTALYITNTYDPLQRISSVTNSVGVTTYGYDDWKTTVTDANSKQKNYYKDAHSNLVKVDEVNGSATYSTNYTWNLNNKLTNITDALGNVRNFTYDGLGQRLTAEDLHSPTDTSFGIWTYDYDPAGNLIQTHNPENQIVDYTYDDLNRVKTENFTGEVGIEITYSYDVCANGIGKLCSVTQPTTKVMFEYTPSGLVSEENREIHKSLFSTSFLYDRQGNVVQSVVPDQDTFYRSYNNAGLLEKIQYGQAGMKSMVRNLVEGINYSPMGQVSYQKNNNGTETITTYDSSKLYRLSGKVTTSVMGNSPMTVQALVIGGGGAANDGNGGGGGAGGYVYQPLFPVTAQSYIITVGTGGMLGTNNNGASSTFSTLSVLGGGGGGLINANGSDGSSGGGGGKNNGAGTMLGGMGMFGQGYGGGGGGAGTSYAASGGGGGCGGAGTPGVSGSGGIAGNGGVGISNSISGTSVTYCGGGAGTHYNGGGLNGVGQGNAGGGGDAGVGSGGKNGVVIIAYRTDGSDGVLDTSTGGVKTTSGAYTIHTFTSSGVFTVNSLSVGNVDVQNISYTYDNVGNITQIVDASDTAGVKTVTYTYDDLNRMLSATATNVASGQSGYTQAFTYDALGNITSGPAGAYVYNGATGSNWANPHAVTSIAGATLTYDKSGNMLSDDVLTNTWNYKQQLVQVEKDKNTFAYTYDHEGNRIRVMSDEEDTYYPNKFYSVDASDKKTKNVFAGDQLVVTIETSTSTNSIFYNHTDHLGSVNVVTDAGGTQTELLDYFPYGSKRIESGTNVGQREFIGQIFDEESGLSYLNARYYEGNRGRFISQDPVFWNLTERYLSDPQQQNSYSYARNNPLKFIDTTGKYIESPLDLAFIAYDLAEIGYYKATGNTQAAKESSVYLGLDLAGLATPGATGLGIVGRVAKAGSHAVDAAKAGQEVKTGVSLVDDGQKILYRLGNSKESASRLSNKAQEAAGRIDIHGVSASVNKPLVGTPCSFAFCSKLESEGFKVHNTSTRNDPGHHTIELPNPVTKEVADKFNKAFGRE